MLAVVLLVVLVLVAAYNLAHPYWGARVANSPQVNWSWLYVLVVGLLFLFARV